MMRATTGLGAAASALVVVLTGCTGESGGSGGPSSASGSGSRTVAATPSASASVPASVTAAELARGIRAAVTAAGTARVELGREGTDFGIAPQTLTGALRFAGTGTQAQYTTTDEGGRPVTVVWTGKRLYVKGLKGSPAGSPWASSRRGRDAELWLSLSRNVVADGWGVQVLRLADTLPRLQFTAVAAAQPGRRTYRAQLTRQQLLATYPAAVRTPLARWMSSKGVTGETVLLTLDDRGRPVREVLAVVPNSAQITSALDYSAWGSPVTVTPPPPGQVHEVDVSYS